MRSDPVIRNSIRGSIRNGAAAALAVGLAVGGEAVAEGEDAAVGARPLPQLERVVVPDVAAPAPEAVPPRQEAPSPGLERALEVGDAAARADEPREYVVQEGDTLASIARQFFGDGSQWERIARANQIDDPRRLSVGTRLRIPEDES